MRLEEFANAQDQLDLWKLVSDAVWAGINTQRQQQDQMAAQSKAQPKSRAKRTGAKGSTAKPIKIPVPRAPPKPVPAPQQKPTQAAAIAKSKGQVAAPAAAPLKPGFTAAQAPGVFGQPAVRAVTRPGARPPAPAKPLTPQQRWLNRRPWGPQSGTNDSQMPRTIPKSRPLPQN
jgi:hypothetical protein